MNSVKKIICLLLVIIVTASTMQLLAQKKEDKKAEKEKQVLKEALDRRFEKDSRYASDQRAAFNRGSWIGSKLSDLIQTWGAPTRVVEDGAGGKIAVYDRNSTSSGGSYTPGYIETATNGFGQTVITGSKAAVDTRWSSQYSESTSVFADKDGIIQKVTFGNDYKRN